MQGPRILVCWFEIVRVGGHIFLTCFPQAGDVEPGAEVDDVALEKEREFLAGNVLCGRCRWQ